MSRILGGEGVGEEGSIKNRYQLSSVSTERPQKASINTAIVHSISILHVMWVSLLVLDMIIIQHDIIIYFARYELRKYMRICIELQE